MKLRSKILALAVLLTAIGAINWGLIGLFGFNLVNRIFGMWKQGERLVYTIVGVAGLLLVAGVAVPKALIALGSRSWGQVRVHKYQPIVGRTLPVITGTTLSGRKITLPVDMLGKITFLVMGFTYEARFDAEDWADAFQAKFGQQPNVVVYLMPMLSQIYRLFEPMIDAGMRRGTPAEMHDRVVSVYAPQRELREALSATPSSETWVFLLDPMGRVIFQFGGAFDEQKFSELSAIVTFNLARTGSTGGRAA